MKTVRAFTLIELLVVIAIIGILAALLLPVLSRAKQKAQGTLCLNDGKQLMTAMTLYTGDNNEFFPPNPDGGTADPGYNWCAGEAGIGGADEFNPDMIKDPRHSLLINYLGGNISVFKCPADNRTGPYGGTDASLKGQTVPAARTFSMNNAVGTIDPGFDATGPGPGAAHSGIPNLSVNGPWLNNQYTHLRNSPWRTFGKATDTGAPGPSMLWVLMDEDVDSINDAALCFGMEQPVWYDAPGTAHNGACGFAFADGHSETHRWLSRAPKPSQGFVITDPQDRQDWLWMRERTSADTTGAMPPPP
jgi:prepilin-type N-terminal cleavage/methylation domain-containing protein/prepilin-type processing-associated H-X9-DG protein